MKLARYFAGKKVLLTGGSSGIGRSTALQLARAGASLLLVGRRRHLLEETARDLEACRQSRDQVWEMVPLDVSDRAATEAVLAELLTRHDVDVLINNAGVAYAGAVNRTPSEVFEEMIRINYLGTVWVTRAVLPQFLRRGLGHLVNVSSMAGVVGVFGYTAYAPSKFAVVGFTEVLRNELCRTNIKVSLLLPPDTRTPQLEAENRTKPPETRAISGSIKPVHPDAVAAALLWGVARGRYRILLGRESRATELLSRWFPGITHWVLDRIVRSVRPTDEMDVRGVVAHNSSDSRS